MSPRRLLQLLDANRSSDGFTIVYGDPEIDEEPVPGPGEEPPAAPDEDEEKKPATSDVATIYVYDAIGGWDGIQAGNFVKAIAAIEKSRIHLRINSPGGDVFDARAIKTALEQHPAKVTAFIDGLAASSASFLMLAADEIKIAPGAFVMIHNPWGFAIGDAKEMRATANLLDQVGQAIRNDYGEKTGLEEEELIKMMDEETWMSAEEAVEKRFCDSLMAKPPKASAKTKRTFDLSAFEHPPKDLTKAAAFADLEARRIRHEKLLRIYS